MSLVNLPTMPYGDLMAVNPHYVTAVQPYSGHIPGEAGKHDMCIVWVARDQGTNLFVCTWDVAHTLAVLGAAADEPEPAETISPPAPLPPEDHHLVQDALRVLNQARWASVSDMVTLRQTVRRLEELSRESQEWQGWS